MTTAALTSVGRAAAVGLRGSTAAPSRSRSVPAARLPHAGHSTPWARDRSRYGARNTMLQASAAHRAAVLAAAEEEASEELNYDLPMPKEKIITKVEIPNFVPRDDFIDQLYRWTINAGQDNAGKKYGMPFKADPIYVQDGHEEGIDMLWGWTTSFVKAGEVTCTLFCGFDDDISKKYRWIGRNMETGMPQAEGDFEEIKGKHFEMWKLGTDPVDDETKACIKVFCLELADAITNYYSFGSCWAEDI